MYAACVQTLRAHTHTGTTKPRRKKLYGISFISVFCVSVPGETIKN